MTQAHTDVVAPRDAAGNRQVQADTAAAAVAECGLYAASVTASASISTR